MVPPKVMDDGKDVGVRVGDGSIRCGGIAQTDKIISPRNLGGIPIFHEQMLTVPDTGMTEMTQICHCTKGIHKWMRVSLVSVLTECYDEQSCFRLEEAHAHPWAGQQKMVFVCFFLTIVKGVHGVTHIDSPP